MEMPEEEGMMSTARFLDFTAWVVGEVLMHKQMEVFGRRNALRTPRWGRVAALYCQTQGVLLEEGKLEHVCCLLVHMVSCLDHGTKCAGELQLVLDGFVRLMPECYFEVTLLLCYCTMIRRWLGQSQDEFAPYLFVVMRTWNLKYALDRVNNLPPKHQRLFGILGYHIVTRKRSTMDTELYTTCYYGSSANSGIENLDNTRGIILHQWSSIMNFYEDHNEINTPLPPSRTFLLLHGSFQHEVIDVLHVLLRVHRATRRIVHHGDRDVRWSRGWRLPPRVGGGRGCRRGRMCLGSGLLSFARCWHVLLLLAAALLLEEGMGRVVRWYAGEDGL